MVRDGAAGHDRQGRPRDLDRRDRRHRHQHRPRLGHKKEANERWLSKIALAQSFYGHFYIEHNRGHHVRVATPEDPASSRLGQSLYAFWPRTVSGSAKSAWRVEKKRYARKRQHPFRIGNDVLNVLEHYGMLR